MMMLLAIILVMTEHCDGGNVRYIGVGNDDDGGWYWYK